MSAGRSWTACTHRDAQLSDYSIEVFASMTRAMKDSLNQDIAGERHLVDLLAFRQYATSKCVSTGKETGAAAEKMQL